MLGEDFEQEVVDGLEARMIGEKNRLPPKGGPKTKTTPIVWQLTEIKSAR
jgi:hypothetical protein